MNDQIITMIYLCIMFITGLLVVHEMLYGMKDD